MKFVVGIDGGGTRTTLEIRDDAGNILERRQYGAFNMNSIGRENFEALLDRIFSDINAYGECSFVCIGAAGISNRQISETIRQKAAKYHLNRIDILGDQEIALYGATGGAAGMILVAGTGSICMGMDGNGLNARAGGCGHLIDDEGSGYALGRDALRAVVRASDGRGESTALTDLIFGQWKIESREELIAKVYGFPDKSGIASLAPLVNRAAASGDSVAAHILENAACELEILVKTVKSRLSLNDTTLSMMGGLLEHDTLLKEILTGKLIRDIPDLCITAPLTDAASGASLLALEQSRFCL